MMHQNCTLGLLLSGEGGPAPLSPSQPLCVSLLLTQSVSAKPLLSEQTCQRPLLFTAPWGPAGSHSPPESVYQVLEST